MTRLTMPLAGKSLIALISSAFIVLVAQCASAQAQPVDGQVIIGGTGSSLGGMSLLAARFMELHPDVEVVVLPSLGSGGGIKAVAAGKISFSVSARPLKDSEKEEGLTEHEYAHTPTVFATRIDNAATDISLAQLPGIYRGETQTWPDGTPLRLVMRPETETDTSLLMALSPEMEEAVKVALKREELYVAINDQDNATALEEVPGALGLITLGQILTEGRVLKALPLDGLEGSRETLLSGAYPYYKSFSVVLPAEPSPETEAFMDFLRSPDGTQILEQTGHVVIDAQ